MPLLEVRELKRSFGGIEAVAGVSFDVEAGSIHGLIGPNGSGKTTIFNVLSGYYAPTAGKILFEGRSTGPSHHIGSSAGHRAHVPEPAALPQPDRRENVQAAALHAGTPWWRHAIGFPVGWLRSQSAAGKTADELLERLGATQFADLPIKSLPYGWQRRVELARALACRPKLLLLDEPAAGLNDDETRGLVEIVRSLRDDGLTMLLIEHDMKVVMGTAEVVTVLDYGRLVLTGSPSAVATDAKVIEAYLGGAPKG